MLGFIVQQRSKTKWMRILVPFASAVLLASSCSPATSGSATATPERTLAAAETTATSVAPSLEPRATTPSSFPDCQSLPEVTFTTPRAQGRIVFGQDPAEPSPTSHRTTAMLDLSTGERIPLHDADDSISYLASSPAGDRLAFNRAVREGESFEYILEVVDNQGRTLAEHNMRPDWISLKGWLDGEKLVVRAERPIPGSERHTVAYPIILNLADGSTRALPPDFPNITDSFPPPDINGYGPVLYDPWLTRALYPVGQDMTGLAVYDLLERTVVTEIPVPGGFDPPNVAWSPDGTRFVAVAIDDDGDWSLTIFDPDGQVVRPLTAAGAVEWIEPRSLRWSPDSTTIGFVVRDSDWPPSTGEIRHFPVVIDTGTGEQRVFPTYGYGIGGLDAPIWSPDGRFLLLSLQAEDASRCSVLLGVATGEGYLLPDVDEPLAWITAP